MIFKINRWLFILIFSSLLGEINAHKVQLVTFHQKTNGLLIRIVVSHVPKAGDIAGWVGQENWFYLTINDAVLGENVLDNLKAKSHLLEIEGIQNQQSVQIGFLLEHPIVDFKIFHSPSYRVFLVQVRRELDGAAVANMQQSEKENINNIFSLPVQEATGQPFYESFIYARQKYGPKKYFVWYDNWYSTESDEDSVELVKVDIWVKHWAGSEKRNDVAIKNLPDKSAKEIQKTESQFVQFGPPVPDNLSTNITASKADKPEQVSVDELKDVSAENVTQKPQRQLAEEKERLKSIPKKVKQKKPIVSKQRQKKKKQTQYTKIPETKDLVYHLLPDISGRKTFLKINCDLIDVLVYLDGKKMGKTPLTGRVSVNPGWHRVRIDIPGAPKKNQYGIPVIDYHDVYVTQGRTQKVTFKFLRDKEEDSG